VGDYVGQYLIKASYFWFKRVLFYTPTLFYE
jgi:hypothetical protein